MAHFILWRTDRCSQQRICKSFSDCRIKAKIDWKMQQDRCDSLESRVMTTLIFIFICEYGYRNDSSLINLWNTYLHAFSLLSSLWVYQSQLRADPTILCPLTIKHDDDDDYLRRGNLLHTWWVRRILSHFKLFKVPWAVISRSGSQISFDWRGRTRGSVRSVSTLWEGGGPNICYSMNDTHAV